MTDSSNDLEASVGDAGNAFPTVADLESGLSETEFNAQLEQESWDASDPHRESDAQGAPDWTDREEREIRALEQAGDKDAADALKAELEARKAPSEAPEAPVEATPAPTPAPAPIPDAVSRLTELVEKLVAPKLEPEAPPPPSQLEQAKAALDRFNLDAKYRGWVLEQLGYTKPEHVEDPHVYRIAETYLERRVEAAERQADRAELEALKNQLAEKEARAASEARDRAADDTFTKALAPYKVPDKTRAALAAAVRAQVANGVPAERAIAAIFEHFGEVLPKKEAAPPPKPAPSPRQQARDRAMASAPRAPRSTRNLEQELRRLEGGGRWS